MAIIGLIDKKKVHNTAVQLWNHEDIDAIEDSYQAVIETEIDVGTSFTFTLQQYYGDDQNHNVDAFAATDKGCREISIK